MARGVGCRFTPWHRDMQHPQHAWMAAPGTWIWSMEVGCYWKKIAIKFKVGWEKQVMGYREGETWKPLAYCLFLCQPVSVSINGSIVSHTRQKGQRFGDSSTLLNLLCGMLVLSPSVTTATRQRTIQYWASPLLRSVTGTDLPWVQGEWFPGAVSAAAAKDRDTL